MVIMKCVLVHVMRAHRIDFKSIVILQNCTDMLADECGSCNETCPTSCGDGNQFLFVNVEEVTHIKEEVDPEPTTSQVTDIEPVVSCMSVCI